MVSYAGIRQGPGSLPMAKGLAAEEKETKHSLEVMIFSSFIVNTAPTVREEKNMKTPLSLNNLTCLLQRVYCEFFHFKPTMHSIAHQQVLSFAYMEDLFSVLGYSLHPYLPSQQCPCALPVCTNNNDIAK